MFDKYRFHILPADIQDKRGPRFKGLGGTEIGQGFNHAIVAAECSAQ